MKSILKRISIFVAIFIVAAVEYFVFTPNKNEQGDVVYTSIEESKLPIIGINVFDRKMNIMHPYTTIPGINAFYDTLTILPEDRKLSLHIESSQERFTKLSYEIRSANLSELIERTDVTDYNISSDNSADVELPIQNLLLQDKEYRLDIVLSFDNSADVHYYTRIMLGNRELVAAMLDLAVGFSERNFDYETARENTMYLESSSFGDNTSLAKVNLKSSFDMLTYNKLKLDVIGEKDIRLCSFDGKMGEIKLNFLAGRKLDDGRIESYEITESFILRQGPERLYMMDYERNMAETFVPDDDVLKSNRILLGTTEDKNFSAIKSENKNYMAFVSNRDLFLFDNDKNVCKRIFSFRNSKKAGMQSNYYKHNIKILSCDNNGNLIFTVYGYMNSGKHEGSLGVSVYKYEVKENAIAEKCFIPVDSSYEEVADSVNTLNFLGANSMMYIKLADNIYGIDISSNDYIVIANNLKQGQYSASLTGDMLAWQSTQDTNGSDMLNFMNLKTGEKKELSGGEGQILRILGFIDSDLVVGVVNKSDIWNVNGKGKMNPVSNVRIVNERLENIKEYKRDNHYLDNFYIENGRIHLDILDKVGDDAFKKTANDTIVSTEKSEQDKNDWIGYYATDDKTRVYFLATDKEFDPKLTTTNTPNKISYEEASKINIGSSESEKKFIAIGHGNVVGVFDNAVDAIKVGYENMGMVRKAGELIYLRADTASARNLKVPNDIVGDMLKARQEDKLFWLRGISLKQSLYYVSNGIPVLAYSDGGVPLIIYGYSRNEITMLDTNTHETLKLEFSAAESMFESSYNDFSCFFTFY